MGLLDASGRRGRLPGGLGGELLPRGLASGGLPRGLLGTGHGGGEDGLGEVLGEDGVVRLGSIETRAKLELN